MAADTGMETCQSPENGDSRKRPLDGDMENGDNKRSHFSSGNFFDNSVLLFCLHTYCWAGDVVVVTII